MMKPYSESIRFYFDTIFLFYRLVLDHGQQGQLQSCLFHLQTAQMSLFLRSCVDAPGHQLFVLLGPEKHMGGQGSAVGGVALPDILCVIQV